MGKILCATRGGEASFHAQDAAIEQAKNSGDQLVFFYVFDLEFMNQAHYAMRPDVVEDEMDKMAKFLLAMAVERAQKQGVEAMTVIKHGFFFRRTQFCNKRRADHLTRYGNAY